MIRALLRGSAALLLVLLLLPFAWTTASGDRFVTVTSGSMVPTFQIGDVVAVKEPRGDELLNVGEIVVARMDIGSGTSQYVHRVDSLTADGAWLRGDANSNRDPQPVTQDQVEGTPRFALTGFGARAFTYFQSLEGRLTVSALALVLFFVPVRARRTSDPGGDSGEEPLEEVPFPSVQQHA